MWSNILFIAATLLELSNAASPVYQNPFSHELPIPPLKARSATFTSPSGTPIDFYEIDIKQFKKSYFPNNADVGEADVLGYDGISPGPTFRVKKGTETVVRFINHAGLGRNATIHLHGSYSRAPFDGWAEDMIQENEYKDYYYPNSQDARTLWYHDHAMDHTAEHVYAGLAGMYIIEDDALESQLNLPRGDYEIPLVFNSREYTASGNISDISGERNQIWGDTFSVNDAIFPYKVVEPRKYRFRMLNGAASRTFNFTIVDTSSNGTTLVPLWVIGSDAGFTSAPVRTESLVAAMAERWEVVVDFAEYKGKNLTLVSRTGSAFTDTMFTGQGDVMQFRVTNEVSNNDGNGDLPSKLVDLDIAPTRTTTAVSTFAFGRPDGVNWSINGRTWSDPRNRLLRNVPRGTIERWRFTGGRGWTHPVHVHLVDFQIVSRTGGRGAVTEYEKVALKDVVTVGVGEQVEINARYAPWPGYYMIHCHNLIHEDHAMMAAFNVTQLGADFGYQEKELLIDPMDSRFRPQPYTGTDLVNIQSEILPKFADLEAYGKVDEVKSALEQYWTTATNPPVGSDIPRVNRR